MKYSLVDYLLESGESNRGAQAERIVLRAIIEKYLSGNTDLSRGKMKTIENPKFGQPDEPEYIDVDRTKVNTENERLSPTVLKKIHKFIESDSYVSQKIEAPKSDAQPMNKVADKKSVSKERSITIRDLPPAPWDSIKKLGKTNRDGVKTKKKTDWRLENIWVSSRDTAEVDIHILWTDYSTVSFLGDMDSEVHDKYYHAQTNPNYEKDVLLWCFHVKQDNQDKERRLFNIGNTPQQIFGKFSTVMQKDVEKRIAQSIKNQKIYKDPASIKGRNRRDTKRKQQDQQQLQDMALGEIFVYLEQRLEGEHWQINVNNSQTSASCVKIDPPAGSGNRPHITKKTKGRATITVGTTSFDVFSDGKNLEIYNYRSNLGENPEDGVIRNDEKLDIDDDYWKKELKNAKDTKYFYLVINGLMTARDAEEIEHLEATPKDEEGLPSYKRDSSRRKVFGKRITKLIGAGVNYFGTNEWADPLLTWQDFVNGNFLPKYGIDKNAPRVTEKYIKAQRFKEWFNSVGETHLKSAGVMKPDDTLDTMKLAFENWALLLMNANEMSAKEVAGMFQAGRNRWKKIAAYLEEMAEEQDWFIQNTAIGDIDVLGLATGDEHWADDLDFSAFTVESRKHRYSLKSKLL